MSANTIERPQPSIRAIAAVIGRVMIATIFLMSAVGNKIPNFAQTTQYMTANGVPLPSLSLVVAILLLLVGSVSIVLGYYARIGASLLLVFLVLATCFFHNFWAYEGQEQQQQMIQFMKNLSMMGTMVFIMAVGSGPLSLDARKASSNQ
jgi:putative oxidoreductase